MGYDTQRLKEDADCRVIAAEIGMTVRGQFCECVSGTHSESQYNHCSLSRNYYHCFSCGDSGDVIALVRKYYANKLGTPVSYSESCRIIGDLLGGHELYEQSPSEAKTTVVRLPFSREEMDLLGFAQPAYSEEGPAPVKMEQLFRTNRPLYYQLIREKALLELEHIEALKGMSGQSRYEAELKAALDERYIRVKTLYERAGGTDDRARKLYSL